MFKNHQDGDSSKYTSPHFFATGLKETHYNFSKLQMMSAQSYTRNKELHFRIQDVISIGWRNKSFIRFCGGPDLFEEREDFRSSPHLDHRDGQDHSERSSLHTSNQKLFSF